MGLPEEATCHFCHRVLHGGRTDRKFCNDTCRNAANREKHRLDALVSGEDARERIIRLIKKNHALLKKFYPRQEEWTVDWAELYDAGFHREYFTGCRQLDNGSLQYFCFEQGWIALDGARLLLSVEPERLEILDRTSTRGGFYI